MVWDQLDVNKPHLVYIILGGFTTLFMLCSSVIKERLYIGEATVATICGIIFGPHAANLINPDSWGNADQITLEFARIVLVVQCFAVGVELPKAYMERHWRSVTFLLIPVMTFGWIITSLFIWAFFSPTLNWLDSLCVAACVTATDPVLASSVVGKGKFAKRVPKHLRDLLSAESGCNDGMAFPFIYLALYIIKYRINSHEMGSSEVALHWICYTILYECIFGAVYGVLVGFIARKMVRYAHDHDLIDRESFLVFYFVLALFCAGSGSILGIDDLLVGFACGVGFSNDGWFLEKTEESHVSNVIDLLINLAFFVYFGTIIPWAQFNSGMYNLDIWRLVVVGILVLLFRRIPIMMALKPIIPDIKTWREALFAGHFGPIGVGAIFVAILARGELETRYDTTTPLAEVPEEPFPHLNIIQTIWPITTFLVMCSIIVHGSSIAVFTLGKHINTLTLTMSYTQANEQGPSWMERLPRIQSRSRTSMSMQRSDSEMDEKKEPGFPPNTLPPVGAPGTFLRRQKEEDNPSRAQSRASSRHRSKRSRKHEAGGPISQSAIAPFKRQDSEEPWTRSDSDTLAAKQSESRPDSEEPMSPGSVGPSQEPGREEAASPGEIYEEGDQTVYEDLDGEVLAVENSKEEHGDQGQEAREEFERHEGKRLMHKAHPDDDQGAAHLVNEATGRPIKDDPDGAPTDAPAESVKKAENKTSAVPERPGKNWRNAMNKMSTMTGIQRAQATEAKVKSEPKHGPARAYQYGNTIIVEDEDGEVIKKYDISAPGKKGGEADPGRSQRRVGQMSKMLGLGAKDGKVEAGAAGPSNRSGSPPSGPADNKKRNKNVDDQDDERLRFTINAGGRRMSKAQFIDQIRQMDPKARAQVVENSDAPEAVKREARKDVREQATDGRADDNSGVQIVPEGQSAPGEGHRQTTAGLHPVASHEEGDLKLVNSNEQEIPFHDVSAELRKLQAGGGESAAERRRRQAAQQHTYNDDSDDDGTDRVPPARGRQDAAEPHRERVMSDGGETAAERRRREGALGLNDVEESDSEEDDEPRAVPQPQNIRFADASARDERQPRQSTLRWGSNRGR